MNLRLIALPAAMIAGMSLSGCDEYIAGKGTPPEIAMATNNCISAVADATRNADVSLIGATPMTDGTSVELAVGGATAPWACDTDLAGNVLRVYDTAEG
ncbi:hypothetical protein [Shimia biformata]|uniref:hypothetical protein n=1 Tax=Shimia biformata TaxID=1294299 RepID=UPI00194DBC96|nr:hypothetical protein [Shimia biformata]